MRFFLVLSVFSLLTKIGYSQPCTVIGTSPLNWVNPGPNCLEGGTAAVGKSYLIIPAGFTLIFDTNADTWTGSTIEVYGTLNFTGNSTINTSINVLSGGTMNLQGKLSLGSALGCGYYIRVATGGLLDIGASADRLTICTVPMLKGAGPGCNNCGGTNSGKCAYNGSPYCEPTGGFAGPTAYDEFGYNAPLPIKILYFTATLEDQLIKLIWATSMEENFHKFIVERSNDGLSFEPIGEVPGKDFNIYDIVSKYSFEDGAPLLGFNYYRLKAVDLDESIEYFGVKAVKLNGSKKLAVFPNPSSGEVISFRTNFSPSETDRIILVNQLGVEIFNAHASTTENNISFQNKLRTGIYMLRYVSRDFERTARVVVKH